ncbi:uncharacterized protein LOC134278152 [Saccostrea cucullata]|uniref:uncharacterized protein LOC134278152 n=1 Tax=Saccostrea cuccullata TaxID=36930 RepID=UPI002ED26CF1
MSEMKIMRFPNAVYSVCFTQTFTFVLCQTTSNDGKCGPSSCCSGYRMKDGLCRVCEDGTDGINCSKPCREGYFGRLCNSKCPLPCNLTCNKVTGQCNNHTSIYTNGLQNFLKKNSWVLAIGSSVLMILSFGCIAFLFCFHVCRKRKDIPLISERNQRNVIAGSVKQGKYTPRRSKKILKRNEVSLTFRDEDSGRNRNPKQMIEINAEITEFSTDSIPDKLNEAGWERRHPSVKKPQYRYSLAKKFEITKEIDISQGFSENEDNFDSDHDVEYDNTRFQKTEGSIEMVNEFLGKSQHVL